MAEDISNPLLSLVREQGLIDDLSKVLKSCPDVKVEVGGYTDNAGDPDMNKRLSSSRARAVVVRRRRRSRPLGLVVRRGRWLGRGRPGAGRRRAGRGGEGCESFGGEGRPGRARASAAACAPTRPPAHLTHPSSTPPTHSLPGPQPAGLRRGGLGGRLELQGGRRLRLGRRRGRGQPPGPLAGRGPAGAGEESRASICWDAGRGHRLPAHLQIR